MYRPRIDAISLDQLRCFVEVARSGSVGEAARRVGITQPAASRRILELEANLATVLFTRAHRRLSLTAQGQLFLRYASATLTSLQRGANAIATDGAEHQSVAVGALPTVAGSLVPQAVMAFRRLVQKSVVKVETGASRGLLAELRAGKLDMVIGRMPPAEHMHGLHFRHLYPDQLGFVARADHPLSARARAAPRDVLTFPLIVPPQNAVIRPLVEAFLVSHTLDLPADRIESTSSAFATALLTQSDAIWLISKGVAQQRVARGDLAFLDTDTTMTLGSIGITTQAVTTEHKPLVALFVDVLVQATTCDVT